MFKSSGAHPHHLAATDYFEPTAFERELRRIFERQWQVVCAERDLGKPGDQFARMLGRTPVLVRNVEGRLLAFRNVCPHRHSMLAGLGCTHSEEFRCQYHGWKFGTDGHLKQLPDGRSFGGWKAKGTGLERLRCTVAFGLVFVNVEAGDGPLEEDWASIVPELQERLTGFELNWVQITEHDANWKVIVENAVESYHVPMLHPETFGTYQEAKDLDHTIDPVYTQYRDLPSLENPRKLWDAVDAVLFRSRKLYGYSHTHIYPNHLVTWAGFYREWVTVEPVGPRRSRRVAYGFLPAKLRGVIPKPLAALLKRELARRTRRSADRILGEDSRVWPSVQGGLMASRFAGVLSAREERVASFQKWVGEQCQRA